MRPKSSAKRSLNAGAPSPPSAAIFQRQPKLDDVLGETNGGLDVAVLGRDDMNDRGRREDARAVLQIGVGDGLEEDLQVEREGDQRPRNGLQKPALEFLVHGSVRGQERRENSPVEIPGKPKVFTSDLLGILPESRIFQRDARGRPPRRAAAAACRPNAARGPGRQLQGQDGQAAVDPEPAAERPRSGIPDVPARGPAARGGDLLRPRRRAGPS